MNKKYFFGKIALFFLIIPISGRAAPIVCSTFLEKSISKRDFIHEAVDLIIKNRDKPYEILDPWSGPLKLDTFRG